jgi:hypothetical protein
MIDRVQRVMNTSITCGASKAINLIRTQVSSLSILTIVECKDVNKNLDVQYVDALHSKMQDVNANKAVLVARKGFSKTAIQKAKRVGITLCTAMEAKQLYGMSGFRF